MNHTTNSCAWVFQVQAEVLPLPESAVAIENREHPIKGAFVNIYVPANSLEDSIPKAKRALSENHYSVLGLDWIRKIEIEEWEEDDGEPLARDLEALLSSGECTFGLFYAYGSHDAH